MDMGLIPILSSSINFSIPNNYISVKFFLSISISL